ncbi:MAG: hypothetical protein K2G85_04395, partial [Muribaculaceae bacterium]|nr:hypothetical protein [Muribaculaceae bacterium]
MKKFLTLFTVLLCTVLAHAQTYEFYYSGATQTYNHDGATKTYDSNDATSFFKVAGGEKTGTAATSTFILPSSNKTINTTKGLKINS